MPDLAALAGQAPALAFPWALGVMAALGVLTLGVRMMVGDRAALGPVQEAARLVRQRPRRTIAADRLLLQVGLGGLIPVAVTMVAFVPLVGGRPLVVSPVGVVWVNALDVTVWALVWLTGWGVNSTYSLIGGHRFLALTLAYELPLMFALTAPAIGASSLDLRVVAQAQGGLWFVVWMPVAFVVYCLGVLGFSVWGPMGAAAGSDLAGGVLAELGGTDRLVFLAGRAMLLVAGAAVGVPLFLGGGSGPLLPDLVWLLVKTLVLASALVWLAGRLPLLRPDRLLEVGWVVLLPLVVVQDLVVSVVVVTR